MKNIIALSGLVFVLAACTTFSQVDCEAGDWRAIGDAEAGRGLPSEINRHAETCASSGVTPDRVAYEQGRQTGLQRYCTYNSGIFWGERGAKYSGVCPQTTETTFLQGYAFGTELRVANNYVSDAEDALEDARENRDRRSAREARQDLRDARFRQDVLEELNPRNPTSVSPFTGSQ